jgi:hypothetical protein
MNLRSVSQALLASLLIYAAAGISGCGNNNSLSSFVILPAVPVVAKGAITKLSVVAVFSDGLTVGAWSRVTWTSSAPTVATVSSTGVVTGIDVGTAVLTATDMSHPSISASVTVSVTELQSISVLPAVASIGTGTTQQFTAIGTYTASTPSSWSTSTTWPQVDMTTEVLWSSSSTTVATIGNILGSHGLATAGTLTGTTTITATEMVTRITGTVMMGTATLNVN